MTNLQVAKWGNSLAVRIPAEFIRRIGVKQGDVMQAHFGIDGALDLRPANWRRKAFASELVQSTQSLRLGSSVMEQLRQDARY